MNLPTGPDAPRVPRWWTPRDARTAPERTLHGSRSAATGGEAGNPWLPASRSAVQRQWQQRRASALQAVIHQIDAARAGPCDLPAWLATSRAQRQRAAARGDARLDADTRPAALACAAWAMEPVLGHAVPAALLDAALALGDGGAVELHTARERHLTLALAGAVAAFSGRPCHLLATGDEMAAATAARLAPLWAACGLTAASVGASTSPLDSLRAYHADIVHASARRVAADLARDRRLRAAQATQPVAGPRPSLTRGQHTALLDDLDRVLIEDALSPLVLSVEEDPTALVAAIVAARDIADALDPGTHLQSQPDGGARLTAAGHHRLAELGATLPVLWRTPERCALLVQQALFVRDQLRPGIDYQAAPGGQPMFDDRVAERLPEREWMTGLMQALQVRLGLPPTPMSRTVERSSLQVFFAGYHQLGGTAPCLDGLASELWRRHGLLTLQPQPDHAAADATPRCVPTAEALRAAVQAALPPVAAADRPAARSPDAVTPTAPPDAPATALPVAATMLLLRRATDASRWADLQQPGAVALALESNGPFPALQALGWQAGSGATVQQALCIVLPEPLDSARAETAFLRRTADAAGTPVTVLRLLHPDARVLHDGLGPGFAWATPAARWLGQARPAWLSRLLPPCLALARWRLGRQHAQQRLALLLRDHQLQQQLSFSGLGSPSTARPATGSSTGRPAGASPSSSPTINPPPIHPPLRATGPG